MLSSSYNAGHFKNTLYELGVILEESYDDNGHECLTIRLPSDRLKQLLGQANLKPLDVLPLAQATLLMPILEEFEQLDEEDNHDEEESLTAEEENAFAEFEALNSAAQESDSKS